MPDGETRHILTNIQLKGGANKKWDESRQVRAKVLNPHKYTKNQLPKIPGTYYDAQPKELDTPIEDYPKSHPAVGNDDSSTSDEDNDPYTDPATGYLTGVDDPGQPMRNSVGNNNDTYEERFHFREFARLELESRWYRVSDFQLWRLHFKFKRVGGKWTNDGSVLALDNVDW